MRYVRINEWFWYISRMYHTVIIIRFVNAKIMEQENLDQMSDVNEPVEEKYYDPDEYRDNEEDN